jgi:prepilin peptidase CpaA
MSPIEWGRWLIAIVLTGILAWAAVTDIRERKIPNSAVIAVLGLSLPWLATYLMLGSFVWVLWAIAGGVIAFVVSFILYAAGVIGAGDSKLFAAVALFTGLANLPMLTVATALAGGAMAAVSFASRPSRAMTMITLRGKGDFGRGIPYGVAIAIGAALVVWSVLLKLPLPIQL